MEHLEKSSIKHIQGNLPIMTLYSFIIPIFKNYVCFSGMLNTTFIDISRQQKRADFNETFMEKADGIIKKYFKDFKEFQANWLVKVTWENMTVVGLKNKVNYRRYHRFCLLTAVFCLINCLFIIFVGFF